MNRFAVAGILAGAFCGFAYGQVSGAQLGTLNAQGAAKGWTFGVGQNAATGQPLSALCGFRPPANWRATARFRNFAAKAELPASYDWRTVAGCPPVRNQGGCGSCWAFATVGSLECNILIKDGVTVDLSEQWLVSCNQETDPPHTPGNPIWGCDGGWWAHDYHSGLATDPCGATGAVFESDFPYTATNGVCSCPYAHVYAMDDWAFIGPEDGVADTNAIKQAIMAYGPVGSGVRVGSAFQSYTGGVFNANEDKEVNHAIVLVGWDDALGAHGAWILRNSWGPDWGLDGYMYIEYGCSQIGYAPCYVDYAGKGLGRGPTITTQPDSLTLPLGGPASLSVAAAGIGSLHYRWLRDGAAIGADTPTCYIEPAKDTDAGSYLCEVSDVRGVTASNTAIVQIDPLTGLPLHDTAVLLFAMLLAACAVTIRNTCTRHPRTLRQNAAATPDRPGSCDRPHW